jgi:hypothetical protein
MRIHRIITTVFIPLALTAGLATTTEGGQAADVPKVATRTQLDAEAQVRKLNEGDIDITVPESPAFVAIGLSPDTIIRPVTPREFATALLNGVDRNGHLQTGIAIDVVPYLVWEGSKVTLKQYRDSIPTQILSRTSASFATTKGSGEVDKSVKLALGLHSTLYDSEDPRLNNDALLQCYSEIPVFRTKTLPLNDTQEKQLAVEKDAFERTVLIPRSDACREQFRRKARWNGTSWIIAAATTLASPTGLAADLDSGSYTYWSSVSYGFDDVPGLSEHAQIVAHVRHQSKELVVDKDLPGGQELRDTTLGGLRFRAGTTSFGLSFEAAYVRITAPGRPRDTATRLAFAAERRLAENLWLNVSFGGDAGADPANTKGMSVLSAFKYAFTKDPSLKVP